METTVKIFLAYSRNDSEYLKELKTHFTPLERSGKVIIWYDGKIEPGAVWEVSIKKQLHSADIILLLVSASAIASDYFYDTEMKDALKRHEAGIAKVIPFILRPCAWKATPLASLQAIPKNGKAVTTWIDRDEAYSDAINSLWELINNLKNKKDHKNQSFKKEENLTNVNPKIEIPQKDYYYNEKKNIISEEKEQIGSTNYIQSNRKIKFYPQRVKLKRARILILTIIGIIGAFSAFLADEHFVIFVFFPSIGILVLTALYSLSILFGIVNPNNSK